jgi:small-conductance mechanosensitive channel
VIFYHYLIEYISFEPLTLTYIDKGYLLFRYVMVALFATAIVSLIFKEMTEYARNGHILFGKFIPLLRFTTISLIWVTTIMLALHYMGIDTSSILTWAWIWWAIFALASKDILSNLIGSFTIIMSRMFDIGDKILIPQRSPRIEGIIEEITLNYTKIMGYDGNVAYIPNRIISNETIENMTKNRYHLYTFKMPFRRSEDKNFIKESMEDIEERINNYNPIELKIEMIDPNVQDYIYQIEIKLPEEDLEFEKDMRIFLYEYIYRWGRTAV